MSLVIDYEVEFSAYNRRPGLLFNQWLSTALQAMGVSPSAFSAPNMIGYGPDDGSELTASWSPYIQGLANEILPFLTDKS